MPFAKRIYKLQAVKNSYKSVVKVLRFFMGKPVTLKLKSRVLKIVITPASINQLKREVQISNEAFCEPHFSEIVVKQRQITPFMAVSKHIKNDSTVAKRSSKMISFSIHQFSQMEAINEIKAATVIKDYIELLVRVRTSNLYKEFQKCIESGFFDFKIPCGFMHGDFCLQNAMVKNNRLYMIDWEYASQKGSILYDWWFLKRNLKGSINQINNGDYKEYCAFITDNIKKLNVDINQFNALGNAMHAVIDFSRLEKRGGADVVLTHSVKTVRNIVESNTV